MSRVTITIDTSNEAFRENGEMPRILHELAERFEIWGVDHMDNAKIADVNGNRVGIVEVKLDA